MNLQHNLDHFIEGYNTTILAYGITGSGKTHTIFGNEKDEGLSYKCLNYIVNRMKYLKFYIIYILIVLMQMYKWK